ncbi:MAG: tRNA uridine(34) 5-carboxymethylaminomethyl modification radical SAM/GNAT enzyme Elp3 [Nitrososphaeria archaeon]
MSYEVAIKELVQRIRENDSLKDLEKMKIEVAKKYHLDRVPKNSDIIRFAKIEGLNLNLVVKPTRAISGVTVIAVMSKPFPCPPQAQCIYCPGGIEYGTPKSYTGFEPASARGKQFNYDPFQQVYHRLEHLESLGHTTTKNEIIIMGGTFLSYPQDYQEWFVKNIYDALNGRISATLEEAIEENEKANHRCVGLTIETRPDFCKEEHVDMMLRYGGTRVEIGVQTLDDSLLKKTHRGHTVADTIEAFRIAKDAGFKVVAHMMPGYPGSDREKDLESFRKLFYDERFKPDMVKIYPTLVVEGTLLEKIYKKNLYRPLTNEEAAELIADVLEITPPWVRVMRIQRDIPAFKIIAGPTAGNLRELAVKILQERGKKCMEIRCREVGHRKIPEEKLSEFMIKSIVYEASEGKEHFISFEDDEGHLAGYLRLRIPSKKVHRNELKGAAIVRELKVVGKVIPIYEKGSGWQHKGIGRTLLSEAERIAKEEYGLEKIAVISGVGVREYYMKLGYFKDGPYVSKKL